MSLLDRVRYAVMVDGVGAAATRLQRRRTEARLRQARPHPTLAPPLQCSGYLKELIFRHYLKGRYASGARPVAWVTSGAPSEFLVALGFHLHYPENHGAVCGVRRTAQAACERAEQAGWSRDLCSYARTDIGTALGAETPVGRIPPPDLLLCCTNICQTVLYWYQVLAWHYGCPLVVVDTPFLYGQAPAHAVDFVKAQLEEAVETAERVAGRSLVPAELERTTRLSKEAVELWLAVLETARARPSPITAFDEFIHLAPIVEMRGAPVTVDYYGVMLAELQQRVARGEGALRQERHRLLWDNLPIWPRLRWLNERLAERGAALIASTYTNAWAELAPLIDPSDPLGSGARTYLHAILNRGTGAKLQTMRTMAADYALDGVILHSDRSCKPYSIGQVDQRDQLSRKLGIPALLLEADHSDPRSFSEEQAATRVDAFLEVLEA